MVINSAQCVNTSRISLLGAFTCHAPLCISSGSTSINTATKVYDSGNYTVGGNIIIDLSRVQELLLAMQEVTIQLH